METSSVAQVFLLALLTAVATGIWALPFLFAKHPTRRWLGVLNALASSLEHSRGDPWEHTRPLPLPLVGPAYGPRRGQRPHGHPRGQAERPARCLIWKGVYLYGLCYNVNRAQVFADCAIDLFARPDTSKLFENTKQTKSNGEERHGAAE